MNRLAVQSSLITEIVMHPMYYLVEDDADVLRVIPLAELKMGMTVLGSGTLDRMRQLCDKLSAE